MEHKDIELTMLRNKVKKLEEKLMRIESVSMLPQTATNAQIVDAVNKIADSMKRKR